MYFSFFNFLFFRSDHEIVEAALPDMAYFQCFLPQFALLR